MLHILYQLFYWPGGIVVGNLIASFLWATPTFIHMHRKLNRHEALTLHLHKKVNELHRKVDNG